MSSIETILTRAMNDVSFADALLANPGKALREYTLSEDELTVFQGISRADFEAFTSASPEERQTFCLGCWGPPLTNHNQTVLKVQVGQPYKGSVRHVDN